MMSTGGFRVLWGALLFFAGVLLVLLLGYGLRDVLVPFVAGFFLAYMLTPAVEALERRGVGVLWASVVVIGCAMLLLLGGIVALMPVLLTQLAEMFRLGTHLLQQMHGVLSTESPGGLLHDWDSAQAMLAQVLNLDVLTQGLGVLQTFSGYVFSSLQGALSVLGIALITPLVAVYTLIQRREMHTGALALIPLPYRPAVARWLEDLERTLSAYLRGMISVIGILAVLYAIAFTALGLPGGLMLGLFSAVLILLPYIGPMLGMMTGVIVALVTCGTEWQVLAVLGVYGAVNMLEGFVLTPRIVGRSVGLGEIWVLFVLLAGESLAGFFGMLVAVPVAGMVAVTLRHLRGFYLQSPFHSHGFGPAPTEARADKGGKV